MGFDGMNNQGLSCMMLSGQAAYNPLSAEETAGKTAVQFLDTCKFVLGKFSSIEEVKTAYENKDFQLTTSTPFTEAGSRSLQKLADLVDEVGPGNITPVEGNTDEGWAYSFHFFLTDATGKGLVFEGAPGNPDQALPETPPSAYSQGVNLYESSVLANQPAFPTQMELVETLEDGRWLNDSSSPLTYDAANIPFSDSGYYGTPRFQRLYVTANSTDCATYMYPTPRDGQPFVWSPAFGTNDDTDAATLMALKRAENLLYGFQVPLSGVWDRLRPGSGVFTQVMYLHSPSNGAMYFKTPRDSTWQEINLKKLDEQGQPQQFSVISKDVGFSTPAEVVGTTPKVAAKSGARVVPVCAGLLSLSLSFSLFFSYV